MIRRSFFSAVLSLFGVRSKPVRRCKRVFRHNPLSSTFVEIQPQGIKAGDALVLISIWDDELTELVSVTALSNWEPGCTDGYDPGDPNGRITKTAHFKDLLSVAGFTRCSDLGDDQYASEKGIEPEDDQREHSPRTSDG